MWIRNYTDRGFKLLILLKIKNKDIALNKKFRIFNLFTYISPFTVFYYLPITVVCFWKICFKRLREVYK